MSGVIPPIFASSIIMFPASIAQWFGKGSGWMSTILRAPGEIYTAVYDKVPLKEVANSERCFPKEWLSKDRTDVTDAFVKYARPLIGEDWPSVPLVGGIQRFTRFEKIFADTKLPAYTPQGDRE